MGTSLTDVESAPPISLIGFGAYLRCKLGTQPLALSDAVALSDAERQHLAALFGGDPLTTFDVINLERGPKE